MGPKMVLAGLGYKKRVSYLLLLHGHLLHGPLDHDDRLDSRLLHHLSHCVEAIFGVQIQKKLEKSGYTGQRYWIDIDWNCNESCHGLPLLEGTLKENTKRRCHT